MSNTDNTADGADTGLTPEQRLEATSVQLVEAGIATINDMKTLRECVAYEDAYQNRTPILAQLAQEQMRSGLKSELPQGDVILVALYALTSSRSSRLNRAGASQIDNLSIELFLGDTDHTYFASR